MHFINVATQFKHDIPFDEACKSKNTVQLHKVNNFLYPGWRLMAKAELALFLNLFSPLPTVFSAYSTIALSPFLPALQSAAHQPFFLPLQLPCFQQSSPYDFTYDGAASLKGVTSVLQIRKKRNPLIDWIPMLPKEADGYVLPCFVSYNELRGMLLEDMKSIVPDWSSIKQEYITVLCGYINNPGFYSEIEKFCQQYSDAQNKSFHLILFMKQEEQVCRRLPNLTTVQVHRAHFLTTLNACEGLVCTAGVEAVCEAIAFQKPALIVPNAEDCEQSVNAIIFTEQMAGVLARTNFDLTDLVAFVANKSAVATHAEQCLVVRAWMERADIMFAHAFRDILQRLAIK